LRGLVSAPAAAAAAAVAGLDGAGLLAGGVVEVGLDGRGGAAEPARDLGDWQLFDVAVVAGERGGASALAYAIQRIRGGGGIESSVTEPA
jgi:hypothetical protein